MIALRKRYCGRSKNTECKKKYCLAMSTKNLELQKLRFPHVEFARRYGFDRRIAKLGLLGIRYLVSIARFTNGR
jgi:hypothetical protein